MTGQRRAFVADQRAAITESDSAGQRPICVICTFARYIIELAYVIVAQQMGDLARTNLAKPSLERGGLLVQFWRKSDLVRHIVDKECGWAPASPTDQS